MGWIGKVVRASACSPSLDARETRAFYFIVCVLQAVSASSGTTTATRKSGTQARTTKRNVAQILRSMVPTCSEDRRNIARKSPKNQAKSMKNRWKIDLGGFWGSKPGSGTRRGAFGTRLGRAKAGSRAILGRPGLAKSGRETSKSEPGTSPLNQVAPGPEILYF